MRHFVAIALATSVVAATACTRTQLSSDPSGSRRTGVRFYDPKPYLLVTKRADVPTTPVVKTEVVTLPDLQHAHYLADN